MKTCVLALYSKGNAVGKAKAERRDALKLERGKGSSYAVRQQVSPSPMSLSHKAILRCHGWDAGIVCLVIENPKSAEEAYQSVAFHLPSPATCSVSS